MTHPSEATDLWADGEPADRSISSGAWRFVLRGAEIADVCFAGRPALRAIRFIVRDHDWRTAENDIVALAEGEDELSITAQSSYDGQVVATWTATVSWQSAILRYQVEAHIVRAFRRNRIGLVVLHRPELAGTLLEVQHPGGTTEAAVFPRQIAPHQPAQQVRAYGWQDDGLFCTLRLSGDVFEMEDQRNWTDASYKTYSTPLTEPFPVTVSEGDRIRHGLEFGCALEDDHHHRVPFEPRHVIIPAAAELPILQVGAGTAPGSADVRAIVDDGPVLVEVPADEACWTAVLDRAAGETAGALDVRIIATSPEQVTAVLDRMATPVLAPRIARLGVYDRRTHLAEHGLLAVATAWVRRTGSDVEIVAGTRGHFTELNRNLGSFDDWSGALAFSLTPQMHDRSRAQLIESLPIQRIVAEQAVRMAAGRRLHLGPVALRPRFNAVATTPFVPSDEPTVIAGYGPEHVAEATDPRQQSPALAAWTVVSVAALAVPGVASITLFETWGPRGLRPSREVGLGPAGLVINWLRSGGDLITPPVDMAGPAAEPIGCIAQQQDRTRQLLIGNPGPKDALLRIHATPDAELTSLGNPSMIMKSAGDEDDDSMFEIRVPAASTARLRSSF